jgi:hypothetical protein
MSDNKVSEKVMERIRNLLAKANDPASSPSEREQYLDEANKRMNRHAIDMAMLDASRTIGEKRKPTQKRIVLFDSNFEWGSQFMTVIMSMCETNRCRYAFHNGYRSITIVGMQEDVDWVEMLWLNVFFQFTSKIQPTWEPDAPLEENIYNFKNAGYKWKDIWDIGYFKQPGGMPGDLGHYDPDKCRYMMTMYKKMCKAKGADPVGTQTFAAYKMTFTRYFTSEVNRRLEEMRASNKKQEDSIPGSAIALRDTSKDVQDFFYLLFPTLTPEAAEQRSELFRKEQEDAEKRDAEYLAGLTPAERKAVLDARAKEEAKQARASDRWYRDQAKKRTYDAAGASAGERAGREVDLSRNGRQTAAGSRTELN